MRSEAVTPKRNYKLGPRCFYERDSINYIIANALSFFAIH